MKNLVDQLAQYGSYHRDHRNILTHFFGVPMILLAVVILLSRPMVMLDMVGVAVSPALIAALLASVFYVRLDVRYGLALAWVFVAMLSIGYWLAQAPTILWLASGGGLFVVGWVIQFVGHYWEGRKPAFVDDIVGLLIGPLFVLAEIGFVFGLRKEVERAVAERCGPVRHKAPTAV